ncbi:MAG: hemerythrin domain-containing protein [Nocardioides sp.]
MSGSPALSRRRATALGRELVAIHDDLRESVEDLRDTLAAGLTTVGPPAGAFATDLRRHCLTLCGHLTEHHTDEDTAVFPRLVSQFPDLAPVVDKLLTDHHVIERIVAQVEATAATLDPADPDAVRRAVSELDGLAAIMGSHFGYEERTIATALDQLTLDG